MYQSSIIIECQVYYYIDTITGTSKNQVQLTAHDFLASETDTIYQKVS